MMTAASWVRPLEINQRGDSGSICQEKKKRARGATETIFMIFQEAISQPIRGKIIWPSDQAMQMTQITKPLLLMLEISQRMFIGD